MAYAVQLTIGTGNKVSINYQSQEVSVSVTYQLEPAEKDLLGVVHDKAGEVAKAHQLAWERMRAAKRQEGINEEMERTGATKGEAIFEAADSQNSGPEMAIQEEVPREVGEKTDVPSGDGLDLDVPATSGQLMALRALLVQAGWKESQVREHLQKNGAHQTLDELTVTEASVWLVALQRAERLRLQNRTVQRASPREKPQTPPVPQTKQHVSHPALNGRVSQLNGHT